MKYVGPEQPYNYILRTVYMKMIFLISQKLLNRRNDINFHSFIFHLWLMESELKQGMPKFSFYRLQG
jgi:hypothetical protein